jgi:hypothetical protein
MSAVIKLIIDLILLVFEVVIGIVTTLIEWLTGGGDGGMNFFGSF